MQTLKETAAVALIKLSALLPLSILHKIGWLLGMLFFYIPNTSRDVTRTNINLCFPQLNKTERQKLVQASLIETAKAGMEIGCCWQWDIDKCAAMIRSVEGLELLQNAVNDERGLIIISGHLGCWEISNTFLAQHLQMTALYTPQKMPAVDKLMHQGRVRVGAKVVPADKKGIVTIRKILSQGGTTVILPDQEPRKGSGIFVPFFGVQAFTMRLVSTLRLKTNAQVISVHAKRLPNAEGFDIFCKAVDKGVYSDDLETSIAGINKSLEACIMEMPEQYQWEYKRFRKRPDGEANIYPRSKKSLRRMEK